jgi:hypothetical protein
MGGNANFGSANLAIKTEGKDKLVGGSQSSRYCKNGLASFILFLGFVVFRYLEMGVRIPILGAIRFELLLGAVLCALAVPAFQSNRNREDCGVGIWVILFFILMAMMTVFSYDPAHSSNILFDRVVKFALFAFLIVAFVNTPKRLGLFIGAFMLACLKMGQEGLLGNITGSLIWENQGVMRLHGSTPSYHHPNSFSGMALGCLPFILYYYPVVSTYLRSILLVQLALMINIIIFTGSRTGYFGCAIMLFFLIWRSKNRKRALITILFSVVGILAIIPQDYIERAQTLSVEKEGKGGSVEARQVILRDAWQIILDNPLGIGVQAFPAVRQERFGRKQDTHNLYYEIATNLGIQGLIIFTGLIAFLLKSLAQLNTNISYQIDRLSRISMFPTDSSVLERKNRHLFDLRVMLATAIAVFLFLIIRLSLGLFGHDLYEIYWWFALGTTVAVWNLNSVAKRQTVALLDRISVRCGNG